MTVVVRQKIKGCRKPLINLADRARKAAGRGGVRCGMAENHINEWDRGRYASTFVVRCDTMLSMNKRREGAETIVAEIVGPGTAARLRSLRCQTFTHAHFDPHHLARALLASERNSEVWGLSALGAFEKFLS